MAEGIVERDNELEETLERYYKLAAEAERERLFIALKAGGLPLREYVAKNPDKDGLVLICDYFALLERVKKYVEDKELDDDPCCEPDGTFVPYWVPCYPWWTPTYPWSDTTDGGTYTVRWVFENDSSDVKQDDGQ